MNLIRLPVRLVLVVVATAAAQWSMPDFPNAARVNAVAGDGAKVFAGTDAGLYVSEDEGRTWRDVPELGKKIDALATLGGVILAGTGQGLYRPGSDGKWERIASNEAIPFGWIRTVGNALEASNGDARWISRDTGAHWSKAPVSLGRTPIRALCASPQGSLYAFGSSASQYRSGDSGAAWDPQPWDWSGTDWAIQAAFSSDGSQVFYTLGDGQIKRSPGKNLLFTTPPNTGGSVLGVIGKYLLVGYARGMSRSGDQGATFQTVGQGLGSGWTQQFAAGSRSVFARQSDGVYRSQDSGKTWKKLLSGDQYPMCLTAQGREVYVPLGSRLYHSVDDGESWTWAESAVPHYFDGERNFMAITSQGLVHQAGDGSLWFTRDHGKTWDDLGPFKSLNGVRAMTVLGDRILAGSDSGLRASDDFGKTWKDPDSALPAMTLVSVVSRGQDIYASGWPSIYRSRNAGKTWSELPREGLAMDRAVHSLALSGDTLYAGTGSDGGNTPGLYFSSGPGAPWQAAAPSSLIPSVQALQALPGRILAGTRDGPMSAFAIDAGSWGPVGPETAQNVIGFFQGPSRLLAFSQGRGIFASEDGGMTWNPSASGLAGYHVLSMAASGGLYIGTARDGLFRYGGPVDWHRDRPIVAGRPVRALVAVEAFLFALLDSGDIARIPRGGTEARVTRLPGPASSPHGLAVGNGNLYAATGSGLYSASLPGPAADFDWKLLRAGSYKALAVRGSDMALAAGSSLLFSRDGGETFPDTVKTLTLDRTGASNPMGFTAGGDLIIATWTGLQVVRSADRQAPQLSVSGTVYSLANRGTTWAVAGNNGVFVSRDGAVWSGIESAPRPAYAVAFSGDTLFASTGRQVKAVYVESAGVAIGSGNGTGNPASAIRVTGFAFGAGDAIRYSVPEACRLTLTLAAVDGRTFRLFTGEPVQAGEHVARLPSGTGLRGPLRYVLETEAGPGTGQGTTSRRSGWIFLP